MFIKTISVSSLNSYIKKMMDADFILSNTFVKGELSNFKIHSSGHAYFSLKDESSKINCVMFKNKVELLKFMPEDGMQVVIHGRVTVYPRDGSIELYADEINLEGLGELYVKLEKLKDKLRMQGFFDESNKKKIPKMPQNIGIVTSPTGAAIRDVINIATRRSPYINLFIYPALVQGVDAPKSIIDGIKELNKRNDIDIIILARGGGSIEELWCFNDESLAVSIYNSRIPIITGIGHETDFTLADFVGDMRAPTPSGAAEIAVPEAKKLKEYNLIYLHKLDELAGKAVETRRRDMNLMVKSLGYHDPSETIINEFNRIDKLSQELNNNFKVYINRKREQLNGVNSVLKVCNPFSVLNRGYAIITDSKEGVVSTIEQLKPLDSLKITLKDGSKTIKITKK